MHSKQAICCCVVGAGGCGFSLYGCTVQPTLMLIITPDAPGCPAPVTTVTGEVLVKEVTKLNMCLFQT